MILERLTLEGFRLHRRTDVAFELGLTAIVGANGSGKSTLLEAVTFALFGEQRGTKETLRDDDGAPYRVRLEFRLGDASYLVERRPDRAFLAQGDKRLAEGLADTTRACVRLLGLGYEQFRNSFLAEQKGLSFLRFRTTAARQEEVARMLGFDRLRRAEGLAAEARRAAGVEARALGETVGDEVAVRAAAREAEEALKAAKTEVRVAKVEAKRMEDETARAEPEGRAAEAYLALVGRAAATEASRLRALEGRDLAMEALDRARQEAAELASLATDAARHDTLTARLPAVRVAREARDEAERLDPGGTASVDDAKARLRRIEEEWRARREAHVADAAAATEALRAAEADLHTAEAGGEGTLCPVCGRPLGPESASWRAALRERRDGAKERLARAQVPPSPPEALDSAKVRLRAAALRASAEDADLEGLQAEIAALAPVASRARSLAGVDRRQRDAETALAKARSDFGQADEAARVTVEALRATGLSDAEAARAALARAASARTASGAAGVALRTAESNLRAAERAGEAAEARLREARERREALRSARYQELLNGAVATELRTLRTALNGALRPDLEARAGELLERMTAGRYRRVRLSAEFEPTVVDEETDRPILSGGEEDVVALALRLALAELVQDRQGHALTLLMLDEAFGALDAERRQSLLDVLTGLKERYAQVIVVSHVDEVAQIADRVLRVVRDATGASRVEEG